MANIGKNLVETLAIAIVYIATAQFGFLAATAPGNVTVVWPPSGIALAAMLLLGYRAWAGVWLGSFLVNVLFFIFHDTLVPTAVTAASSIAVGSMLQAMLAAFLYRRMIGPCIPHKLKGVFSFMTLAIASCLVAPTVGVTSLAFSNAITWSKYPDTWLTWWLGDVVGILAIAPVLLMVGYKLRQGQGTRYLPFPLTNGGVGLCLMAGYNIWQLEDQGVTALLGVNPAWLSWGLFAAGLLLAVLLASYIEYHLGIEAALRESERRSRRQLLELETLYRTAPIGLALVDHDLRFLRINEKLAEMNGVPMDAHIGHILRQVVPGLAETIEPSYRRVFETGEPVLHIELHGTTSAQPNIERDWLVDYYPLKESDGSVQAVGAIVVEITARKRAEVALRESEQRFRDFADSASDWFWEIGPDLRFTWMSDQLKAVTGISPASLIGCSYADLGKPLVREEGWLEHREDLRVRRPFEEYRYQLEAAGGEDIYVSVSGVPIFGGNGEFRGYRGTGKDITAQMLAQNEASQAKQRLSDAIESISEGFALWDADDRFVLCNSRNREFYSAISDILCPGISFEDVIRESVLRGTCHLGNQVPEQWIQERVRQHRNPSGPWEQHLSDGRWLLVTERKTPEGGIVGLRTDITGLKDAEEALCRSKEFLDHVLDAIDDDVFVKDEQHAWVVLNKSACELIGGSREELIGKSDHDFFSTQQAAQHWETDDEVLKSGKTVSYEWQYNRNGQCRTFLTKKSSFLKASSGKKYIAGVAIDITDRKRIEEALFNEKERAEVTLHCIGDGVITTDPSCRVEYLNPVAETLTGWKTEEVRGKPLNLIFNVIEEQSRTPMPNPVARCLKERAIERLASHAVLISRHGKEHAIEHSVAPIRGHEGEALGAVLVFHDVSETRRMALQLQHDAAHDALTGLINRREFEGRLERAVASAKRYGFPHALCYFDLDQFKLVNDTAGHAAGDALLKHVRGLLSGRFRERDTLARLGGDEFALLLENCGLDEAIRIAEIIVATFREWSFVWEGRTFHVGVSVGVVAINSDVESAAELLSQADVACYAAKERGRNRVDVYRKDGSPHHAQILVAATLRDALEQNRFRLFCQPIVELSGNATGPPPLRYELLIRLLEVDGRLVLPKAFIPAAERYGLMSAIDRWVIETAFRAYGKTHALRGVEIAINLSGDSLNTDDFPKFVLERFQASSVPPDRVCFEITETAAIHNLDRAIEFVTAIKKGGSRVALDDFGNGLSSFRYLRLLPADYLKIDGSFVRDMLNNPREEALVAAINEVGHTLGITTIAEYAHSAEIVERLRQLGVDCAQGYAFGVPVPLEDMLLQPDSPLRMEARSSQ